jgi:ACS family tartrate transporter-like MFS transporter
LAEAAHRGSIENAKTRSETTMSAIGLTGSPAEGATPTADTSAALPGPHQDAVRLRFTRKLVPFLALLYLFLFLDRVNINFAGLQMTKELNLSATAFGLAVGLFSIGYFVFEIPSTLMLRRYGARRWLTRIMITWGMLSVGTAFVSGTTSLYLIRFLLGAAEAGFVPGVIYYLTNWLPAKDRGRVIGGFMLAVPLSTILGAPISGILLGQNWLGLHGWQWLFIIEGMPSVLLGFSILYFLPNGPTEVDWLTPGEKAWIVEQTQREQAQSASVGRSTIRTALTSPTVIVLGLIYLGNGVGLFGVSAWLPLFMRNLGLSFAQTGWLVSGVYVVMALWMLVWTRHSDTTGERIWHVAIPSLFGVACIAIGALWHAPVVAVVFLSLSGILMNPATPAFWNLPPKYLSGAGAAAGIAFISSIGALGAFIGPALLGFIKDQSGTFSSGLLFIAAGPLISAMLTIGLRWHPAFRRDLKHGNAPA